MSAVSPQFISGSRLTGNSCPKKFPCQRQWLDGRPSGLPRGRTVCASRVCASEFLVDGLTGGALSTERLEVCGDLAAGRLVVGPSSGNEEDAGEASDKALRVNGDATIGTEGARGRALLIVDGDLVLGSGVAERDPARLVARRDGCPAPLVLDLAYDDPEGCSREANYLPEYYEDLGLGLISEVKRVQALLPSCPDPQLLGYLETRVIPGGNDWVPWRVMQSLWTVPIDGWSVSGLFQRSSSSWGTWKELLATVV